MATANLLTVGQAADYLGISAATLRAWSDRGLVPVYRTPGQQRRFSVEDLDAFLRSMRQPTHPTEPARKSPSHNVG